MGDNAMLWPWAMERREHDEFVREREVEEIEMVDLLFLVFEKKLREEGSGRIRTSGAKDSPQDSPLIQNVRAQDIPPT